MEKRVPSLLLLVFSLVLFPSCSLWRGYFPHQTSTAPVQVQPSGPQDSRIVNAVNSYRASHGKPALQRDSRLDAIARSHSATMMRGRSKALVTHTGYATRSAQARQKLGLSGFNENVGFSSGGSGAASQIVNLWTGSRAHRSTLLGNWQLTGIGTAVDRDGAVFVTQVFGRR